MQGDIQFIDDPGGMKALFREARERTSAQLQSEFYVALNLEQLPINEARNIAAHASGEMPATTEYDGTAYYHLTPVYFAWLHSRMRQAKDAHKSGKLSDSAWATARMLWNEILDKANRAYGRSTLETAVKHFRPGSYHLPPAASKPKYHKEGSLPASCPYSPEYLEHAARETPQTVPCPATKPAWWWVERKWCEAKCGRGHPECIRHLYWSDSALQQGEQE